MIQVDLYGQLRIVGVNITIAETKFGSFFAVMRY